MNIPQELRYTQSHEWVRIEGDIAYVGITDHAQEALTDVVFVELPEVGKTVEAGQPTAVVESVKAASDIYSPLSGEVVAGNEELSSRPDFINTKPYESWIFQVKLSNPGEVEALLDAAGYAQLVG